MISVVIPTRNAALSLPAAFQSLLDAAIDGLVSEVIISDSGSADATRAVADAAGATVVEAAPGRQLLAGAQAARKPWILFLEPGTVMERGWEDEARAFIARGGTAAAAFRYRLAAQGIGPRLREAASALRLRAFRMPARWNGLLIPVRLLDAATGFAPAPAMPEARLMRRLGRSRVVMLRAAVIADSSRA